MSLGVIVVFVGFLGTLEHSGMRKIVASWIDIPALFGVLLFTLVVARLQGCLECRPPTGAAELRQLTRHLSRIVYLLLYLIIGAKVVVNIVNDFILTEAARSSPKYLIFRPVGDLREIFAYGLVVLIAIRVLILWLFRSRRL
jgi:cytochrome b561